MAYGTPANPVSGTVITVAYAVTNLLDPIRWLRLMTGNTDPPGSSYVAVSDSVSGVTWRKIPSDAIADGAITAPKMTANAITTAAIVDGHVTTAKLADGAVTTPKIADGNVTGAKLAGSAAVLNIGYTPVNRAGDTMSAPLVVSQNVGTNNNLVALNLVNQAGGNSGTLIRLQAGPSLSAHVGLIGGISHFVVLDPNGLPSLYLDGLGHIKLLNGTVTVWDSSNFTPGTITAADASLLNGQPGTYYRARANHTGTQLAATISDLATAVTNFSGSLAGDVTGTQSATVVANKVPTGGIIMFRLAAEIPAGWTRESALDGRSPVGTTFSGVTLFGQTFDEATSYGTNWTPAGGVTLSDTLTVNNGTLGVSGIQPTATASEVVGATSATLFKNSVTHNHPAPSITGAIARAGSISISGTTAVWIHPSRGYNFARKN